MAPALAGSLIRKKLMLNEFVMYAALASAVVFGVTWFVVKDRSIAWIVSVLLGAAIIIFVFPAPTAARTLFDVAGNMTLLIQKAIYAVVWVLVANGISLVCKRPGE
jgi:hypothetical protein